jgi:signal transduction histidine kinase
MKTKHHILAVDDEKENLSLIQRIFRAKYEVHTVLTAGDAIDVLEKSPVDLILCDQRMPGRTGVDLLEEVRERWPRVTRILVTAYADIDAAVAAINRGEVRRYISKPWDNEELEAIVAQELRFRDLQEENERLARDLEKQNRQLIEANQALESLDRMKSKLLANVSHELKTPLITIKGYTEMLESGRAGEVPKKGKEFVAGIRRGTERLESLIGNLLQGARMASESDTLVLTVIDLVAWTRTAVRGLRTMAEEKGVSVKVTAPRKVKVTADASSIDRILENLLSNAIKFNVRGGEVRVEVKREGSFAEVIVTDTGIGIPKAARDRIFERFFQADKSQTHRYGGTGIGLSIVKEVVDRHGGRVEVDSEPGKGSTFRVLLPATAKLKDDSGEFLRIRKWEGTLVVVADPDDSDRETERATLLGEGFAVMTAFDLDGAAELTRRHLPHVVLFDASLLEKKGSWPDVFSVPTVAMLPERKPEIVKKAAETGSIGSILKPFQKEDFIFLMEKIFDR